MTDDAYQNLRCEQTDSVLRVTLHRPEVHNAFDDELIRELTVLFDDLPTRKDVRVVILTGEGRSFCAGADLNWMRRMAEYDAQRNLDDARALAGMLNLLDTCPQAVIGRVNGSAFGGACGLIACCDVAVTVEGASFAFSEVKLGLVPATIAPFVQAKLGVANTRRYFITGERFGAETAREIGLVQEVVVPEKLDEVVNGLADEVLSAGPEAVTAAKRLIAEVTLRRLPEVNEYTARLIAEVRGSDEAQERMRGFLDRQSRDG